MALLFLGLAVGLLWINLLGAGLLAWHWVRDYAVARVAGLLAIAVFGVLLVRTFDARATTSLDHLALPQSASSAIDRELPKMAGADFGQVPSLGPSQRTAVHDVIAESFVWAFRVVFLCAAAVVLLAAIIVGAFFHEADRPATR